MLHDVRCPHDDNPLSEWVTSTGQPQRGGEGGVLLYCRNTRTQSRMQKHIEDTIYPQ